jgi:hypothetical protein
MTRKEVERLVNENRAYKTRVEVVKTLLSNYDKDIFDVLAKPKNEVINYV